jgi:hypothetical protein
MKPDIPFISNGKKELHAMSSRGLEAHGSGFGEWRLQFPSLDQLAVLL